MSSFWTRLKARPGWPQRLFPARSPALSAPAPSKPAPLTQPPVAGYQTPLLAALGGAVGLTVLGQYVVAQSPTLWRPGSLLVVVGLALMVLAHQIHRRRTAPAWLVNAGARLGLAAQQPIFLLIAFGVTYAAKLCATDSALPPNPIVPYVLWAAAIGMAIAGSRRLVGATSGPHEALGPPWSWPERLVVLSLFTAALLIRALNNGQVPGALSGDEGSAGVMALEWVGGKFLNPFVTAWFSFPSLFFTLPAAAISLLGRTYTALRGPSAIAGALTVISLYWMARPMFGRATALLSAIVLAALNLHVHFSRIGLNNIWDGLFFVLNLGLVWRGWQSGRRGYFVAAGLVLGLSQYFYTSALLLPLVMIGWLGLQVLFQRSVVRQRLPDLLLLALVALVVYLPLGLFYLAHPHEFSAPMNRVSLLAGDWFEVSRQDTGLPYWRLLFNNYRDAALAFTSVPLRAWYGAGKPLLLPLTSALFTLGLMLLIGDVRLPRSWLLLLWLAGITSIGALTESTPAGQRYVIAAPVAALLVGLAAATLADWLSEVWPRRRQLVGGVALVVVLAGAAQDLRFYFSEYTPIIGLGDPNTQVASVLGDYLGGHPPGSRAYFFGPPRMGYVGFSTLRFLAPNVTAEDIVEPLTAPPDWELAETRTVFIFLPERQGESVFVVDRYPGGESQWFYNRQGEALFWIYELGRD